MKVGMGVRGEDRLNKDYIKHIAQIGAPHAIVFMPDKELFSLSEQQPWTVDELTGLRKFYKENGVSLLGFENFHPGVFYKVLLDLPGKEEQMEYVKRCIDNMGKSGYEVMGYNFSLAGVTGRELGPFAREGAETVKYVLEKAPIDEGIPLGEIFNRIVVPDAPKGTWPAVSLDEMVERRDWFLSQIIPVAEEAGIKMSAHPEDPPVPVMKRMSRILTSPKAYDEMFAKFDSPSNCIEFCQGTFAEMDGVDVYETIKRFASMDKIGYVHFRNVKGTVGKGYTEAFIDDGDTDMAKALTAYKEGGYKGMLMPDHTPAVSLPGHRDIGMAYAIGYMRGIMKMLDIEIEG